MAATGTADRLAELDATVQPYGVVVSGLGQRFLLKYARDALRRRMGGRDTESTLYRVQQVAAQAIRESGERVGRVVILDDAEVPLDLYEDLERCKFRISDGPPLAFGFKPGGVLNLHRFKEHVAMHYGLDDAQAESAHKELLRQIRIQEKIDRAAWS